MVKIALLILITGVILYAYVNFLPIIGSYFQQVTVGTSVIPYKVKEVKEEIKEKTDEEEPDYEKKAEEEIDKILHIK
ncbi:hypothetical protein [Persephonella sp.]